MLKSAPKPVEVQEFQFKLRCRLKVFDNKNNPFPRQCSLVACASRFGLIFIGTDSTTVQVIQTKNLEEINKSVGDKADYPRRNLTLSSPPSHLSVNCEHTILSVIFEKNGSPCAVFYDVKSFWQKDVVEIGEVRLSATPGVYVTEVNWNPALGSLFTACKSDGTLGIYEIKNPGIDINELPPAAAATCFCWSPKGKQIAVGSKDGKITQYKPDLKAVKVINAPQLKETCTLLSLQWVSNYQFIGVFQPNNPDSQTRFIVVDSPKSGECSYTNYDDICFSNGNVRPAQFYLNFLQTWNVLMAASSNSTEVGILTNMNDSWTQWILGDASRAELPLSLDYQETLPIGCAVEISSTQPIPWGESTLPPVPLLLLLSNHGILCCFNIINLKDGTPSLCTPPDPIKDLSGLQHFVSGTTELKEKETQPKINVTPSKIPVTTVQQGFNVSQSPSLNLFGGQATLIPISQSNKNTPQIPVTKFQSVFPNLDSKAVHTTPSPVLKIPAPVSKPVIPDDPPLNKTDNIVNVDLKVDEETEKIFSQMVKEECVFLESELKAILHQGRSLKLNLGSDDDKTNIVESTKLLEEFFNEVLDICTTQNAEVHILKQNLLQSWAWYEEVKSRHLASLDESMMTLIRAQPLDSASEKQISDIHHSDYYLESQIAQAHVALDGQWENFQDYCKKTCKIQIPTMEMIYQTMVKQNAILRKQSYVLKDISNRIKSKSRSAFGPSLLLSSVDNARDLPEELKRLRLDPEDICQIQYERVLNRAKNFSPKKVNTLRTFLNKRQYPRISAVKPQLNTSVIQLSPSSKLKNLSVLSPKTLPILKELPAKKLDFQQSTPKVQSETRPNTAIEGLQNFTVKFETKNFTEKTFTPITKSLISGSPTSAFVSTSVAMSSTAFKPNFVSGKTDTSTTPITSPLGKTFPSYVIPTTTMEKSQPVVKISTSDLSKSFSFANPENTSLFATTKPSFSFNLQPMASKTTSSSFSVTSTKPSTTFSGFTMTPVTKTDSPSVTTTKTSSFSFGTVTSSTPSFAFGATTNTTSTTATSSIFSSTTQKPADVSVSKPFVFSSKTTTTVAQTTTQPINLSVTPATTVETSTTTTKVTQSSIFNTAPLSGIKPNLFASVPQTSTVAGVSTTATVSSSSPVTTSTTTGVVSTVSPVTTSIFNSQITTSPVTTTKSIFGSVVSSSATQTTTFPTTGSVFGNTQFQTKPSVFGNTDANTSKPSMFGGISSTTSQSSVFGNTTSSATSVFGNTTSSATSPSSVFGNTTSSTTSQSSVFGNTTSTTSPSSVFGNTTSSVTSQPSVFGNTTSSTTSQFGNTAPLFGSTPPATTQSIFNQTSVFGATVTSAFGGATSTSQPSGFGSFGDTTQKTSVFGNTPSVSTQSSIFGSTSQSVFGNAPNTTSSVFGQSQTFGQSSQSVFGSPGTGFGNTGSFGQTSGSIFGNTATTSSTSIFGGSPKTFSSNSSVFVSPTSSASSPFGSSSVFSPNTTQQTSSFAPNTNTASFGFGGLNVGSTPTTSNTSFGATANPFGGGGENKTIFGNTSASSSTSIFGSNSGNTFGSSSQNFGSGGGFGSPSVFGQQSSFGQTSSTFGSGSTFGQQPSGPFSSGNTGSVSQTGFGGSPTFQKQGFGSSGVFGGSPSFGSAPSFGGAPSFGSSPTFGNTTKVFGANAPTFGGSTGSQAAGFGNIANQPTVGFGNLAQQATNAQSNAPFSGNSSFSSWR